MALGLDRETAGDEDALLGALLQLHRAKKERARSVRSEGAYSRILSHFEQRGHRLRGEKLMTSEIVERLLVSTKALPKQAPQQELQIVGIAGTSAAGRFRLTNKSTQRARFELVVGGPMDGREQPAISFSPSVGELDAGFVDIVRVEASLRRFRSGETMTVPIECRWGQGRDRLWLVISSHPEKDDQR